MPEFETREWIAYALVAGLVAVAFIVYRVYRSRRYWRKLRLSGNGKAKRREIDRGR